MRLVVCVFWEKHGLLRDYAKYYIEKLLEFSDRFVVVVNGEITDSSKQALLSLGCEVVRRENKGLDFAGYKYAINMIGYSELSKYDELLLTNTTCYGPVFPFSNMFDEMKKRDCDFWGVTEHKEFLDDEWLNKVVHRHLQSYFINFKRNVFTSASFKEFFDNVDENANGYKEVVERYETELTYYLNTNGFKSSCYTDCERFFNEANNPSYIKVSSLISECSNPLVKRKALIYQPNISIRDGYFNNCNNVLKAIEKYTDYDINLIYKDLIRENQASWLKFSFHYNFILPEMVEIKKAKTPGSKVAAIVIVNSLLRIKFCIKQVMNMPEGSDVYFVCNDDESEQITKKLSDIIQNNINIHFRRTDGDNYHNHIYFDLCKDVFESHDYVCCVHTGDKSISDNYPYEKNLLKNTYYALISSREYINNVLYHFENKPYLGMVVRPAPLTNNLSTYLWGKGVNKFCSKAEIESIRDLFNLHVPMDDMRLSTYCGMFWVKSKALSTLFNSGIKVADHRSSHTPLPTVIHDVMDVVLPQIVQEDGYVTANMLPSNLVSEYIDSMYYNTRVTDPDVVPVIYTRDKILPKKVLYIKNFRFKDLVKYLFSFRKTEDKLYNYMTVFGINILLGKIKKKK